MARAGSATGKWQGQEPSYNSLHGFLFVRSRGRSRFSGSIFRISLSLRKRIVSGVIYSFHSTAFEKTLIKDITDSAPDPDSEIEAGTSGANYCETVDIYPHIAAAALPYLELCLCVHHITVNKFHGVVKFVGNEFVGDAVAQGAHQLDGHTQNPHQISLRSAERGKLME